LLEIGKSLKLIEEGDFEELIGETVEISKMVNSFISSIR
jgi:hypothetical protein